MEKIWSALKKHSILHSCSFNCKLKQKYNILDVTWNLFVFIWKQRLGYPARKLVHLWFADWFTDKETGISFAEKSLLSRKIPVTISWEMKLGNFAWMSSFHSSQIHIWGCDSKPEENCNVSPGNYMPLINSGIVMITWLSFCIKAAVNNFQWVQWTALVIKRIKDSKMGNNKISCCHLAVDETSPKVWSYMPLSRHFVDYSWGSDIIRGRKAWDMPYLLPV